ncbi:uncharacterized protein LOC110684593 [Chenopodium quinoa]|uniref:uncharacterized protein LOC110684593 n=1 Tax=Chenopodium quinoa TaxID=63459 RepID=UPI000B76F2DE|nr:uncharacterized protein LOC110684593 [Chenopodium quinoa]
MMNNKKFDRNKKFTSSRNTTCFRCGSKDHFIKDCPVQDGEKGKTKGKEQSKESKVYKPYFTKDNVKKAMLAAWGDTDSEEEEDQPLEETAHLCLMEKTYEAAKLKGLESEVWFSYNQLKHLSKENLINTVLEIQEDLKELHRSKQQSDKALVTYKEDSEWVDNMKFTFNTGSSEGEKHLIGRSRSHAIDNVFLVEGLKHNLLSISQFCDKGNSVSFTSNKCRIIHNDTGNIILEGTRKGNTYIVDLNEVPNSSLTCLSVIEDDPLLWQRSFSAPRTPQQNKVVERKNRSLEDKDYDDDFEIGLVRKHNPYEEPASQHKQKFEIAKNVETPEEVQTEFHEHVLTEEPVNNNEEKLYPIKDFTPRPWKYKKSHPVDVIMNDITKGTQTRSQLRNFCAFNAFLSSMEPKNYVEALTEADWINAMQAELNEFERNKVWHLEPRPKDKKSIGLKWVFRNKLDEHGIIVRNMDVKCAFSNGYLNEEAYVEQPSG